MVKIRKKIFIVAFIVILVLCGCRVGDQWGEGVPSEQRSTFNVSDHEVQIDKEVISGDLSSECNCFTTLKHSIEITKKSSSDTGDTLHSCGLMYYEYPFFITQEADTTYAAKVAINKYFENTCKTFFSTERTNAFLGEVESKGNLCPGNIHSQYANTMEINRVYYNEDKEIFSVSQTSHWFVGGINYFGNHGEVFSLHTGGKMTIDSFIDLEFGVFRMNVLDYLAEARKEKGMVSFSREELEDFQILSDSNSIDFYYEDEMLYIFLPAFVTSETPQIIVWSVEEGKPVQFING